MRMKMRKVIASTIVFLVWFVLTGSLQAQVLGDLADSMVSLSDADVTSVGKQMSVTSQGNVMGLTFTGIIAEVGTSDTAIKATFRFRSGRSWGPWLEAHVVPSATGGTAVVGYRTSSPIRANEFEVQVTAPSGTDVVIRDAGTFDNSMDDDLLPAPLPAPLVGSKNGAIIPPRLITREQWQAQPFRGNTVNLAAPDYEFLTWHHAAGYSAETEAEGKAQMRAMQDLHQNIRGWSDIGYQFGIDRGGRLYQGRPFRDGSTSLSQVPVLARGAHVGGANTGNIGVVIMGCYHPPEGPHCEQEITPAAFATYVTLFSFLSERYGVAPTLIRGHRDFSSTACPGDNNYARIPELISKVSTLLITGNEPLGEGEMTASLDDDGVIDLQWSIGADFGIQSLEIERITSQGEVTVVTDAATLTSFVDGSLAGETSVTYLLIANGEDGRRQELARIEVDIPHPSRYILTSAYPNPASGKLDFKYFLSTEGIVSVHLYDAQGREVLKTDAGFQTEDQWYTSTISVSDLPGGTYFLRMRVESFGGIVFDKTHPVVVVN